MRPLRLVMKAFGPYATEQVIDFAELQGQRLFLIHGPTGGGKTTILDAICYALYGDTSGERKGEQMRSHLASPDVLTEIELEFALGDKQYRVRRSPRQTRPKKRGEGTVEIAPEAELAQRKADQEFVALESGADKVRAQVEGLLGFRSEQFRQVIMLPQGKFRELLLADSKDREAILEMLFQTGYYERLQDFLAAEAKTLTDQLRVAQEKRSAILTQANVENVEGLTAAAQQRAAAIAEQEQVLAQLREAEARAEASLNEAQRVVRLLDELEAAQKELAKSKEWEPRIEAWRKALHGGARAQKVVAEEQEVRRRAGELEGRRKTSVAATLALRNAVTANARAAAELRKAEGNRAKVDTWRQQLAKVEALRPRIARLEQAERSLAAAHSELVAQTAVLTKEEETIARAAVLAEGITLQVAELRERAAGLESHQQLEGQAQRHLKERQQLETLRPLIHRYEAEQQRLEQERKLAEDRWLKGKGHLADLLLAWRNGRAASLAAGLREGEPCPVCGSREHPAPAHAVAGDVPDDEELARVQQQVWLASSNEYFSGDPE